MVKADIAKNQKKRKKWMKKKESKVKGCSWDENMKPLLSGE